MKERHFLGALETKVLEHPESKDAIWVKEAIHALTQGHNGGGSPRKLGYKLAIVIKEAIYDHVVEVQPGLSFAERWHMSEILISQFIAGYLEPLRSRLLEGITTSPVRTKVQTHADLIGSGRG